MLPKKIYTIIVNHNGREILKDCLESLAKVRVRGFKHKILIIDNASLDDSVVYLKKKFPKIRIYRNHRNTGFTGAVNTGIKIALKKKAKYILLLNNDTIVTPSFLQKLVDIAEKKDKAGIISPLILKPGKKENIWYAGGKLDPKRFSSAHIFIKEKAELQKPYETGYISGCAMLIKPKVIEKIGFFDTRFFLYYEDVDFSLRAKKAGFKLFVVPNSLIYHKKHQSKDAQEEYYLNRNHLLLITKHASLKIKLRELARTVKSAWEKLENKDDSGAQFGLLGIKDFFLRRFGKREHWY